MKAYRLTKKRHQATAFSGEGAQLAGGRWNFQGRRVVYCSEPRALAALELFVNLDPAVTPNDLTFVEIEIPDELVAPLDIADLPRGWRVSPAPEALKAIGSRWLDAQSSLGLLVPSAVVPEEKNLLLNPELPQLQLARIGAPHAFQFDPRIWKNA